MLKLLLYCAYYKQTGKVFRISKPIGHHGALIVSLSLKRREMPLPFGPSVAESVSFFLNGKFMEAIWNL